MAKKRELLEGDVFIIQLDNGKCCVGQVLDLPLINCVRCAFFDEVYEDYKTIDITKVCKRDNLISLIEVTKEQLDFAKWIIIGNKKVNISKSLYPNEQFRIKNWVGSIIYDAAIAEDFMNAFYALRPWNDWANPNFLDELLIDKTKKPKNLSFIKN